MSFIHKNYICLNVLIYLIYLQFQNTLPKYSLQMHWISVRFYEIDDTSLFDEVLSEKRRKLRKNAFFVIICFPLSFFILPPPAPAPKKYFQ